MQHQLKLVKPEIIKESKLKELIDRFLINQDVKASSLSTYKRALKQFIDWIESNNITNPIREDILSYKNYLISTPISSMTISLYLVVVRKFFEYCEGIKLYPNIAKGIKGSKRDKGFKKDCLTISQAKELLNIIDRSTLNGKRDYSLLKLRLQTGLRNIEVVNANIEDIRQNTGEAVLWIQGKGHDSKDEYVLLTDDVLKAINEYLLARGKVDDKEPLFVSHGNHNKSGRLNTISLSRIIKNRFKEIGLNSKKLSAHSLRHSAITFALLSGASLQETQAMARHTNINTTMIYAHNINRIENAAEKKISKLFE